MEPFSMSLQLLWSIGSRPFVLDLMGVDRVCFYPEAYGPGTPGTMELRVVLSSSMVGPRGVLTGKLGAPGVEFPGVSEG